MSVIFHRPTVLRLAAMLLASLAWSTAGLAKTADWIAVERQSAQSWGMHRIAVLQAAAGDVQGAKKTLTQIGDRLPFFEDARPWGKSPGWGGCDSHGTQYFLTVDRPADQRPAQPPADLPSDYLDPDPRHGPVVDFADERDSHGTRVTSRRYADGHTVIETP